MSSQARDGKRSVRIPMVINVQPVARYLKELANTRWYDPKRKVGSKNEFISTCVSFIWLSACYLQQETDVIRRGRYRPSGHKWMGATFFWGSPGGGKTTLAMALSKIFLVEEFYPDPKIWEEIEKYIIQLIGVYASLLDDEEGVVTPPRPSFLQDEGETAWLVKEILKNAVLAGLDQRLFLTLKRTPAFTAHGQKRMIFNPINPTLIAFDPSVRESVDVRGPVTVSKIKTPEAGKVEYSKAALPAEFINVLFLPMGVFVIDDFPFSDQHVMKALRMTIQEGALHAVDSLGQPIAFPLGWRILCTGNYPGQAAMAREVPEVVRNRMVNIVFDRPVRVSERELEGYETVDEDFVLDEEIYFSMHPIVAEFIVNHPKYAVEDISDRMASATIRTFSYVSAMFRAYSEIVSTVNLTATQMQVLETVLRACVEGAIGMKAARELYSHYRTIVEKRVPTVQTIISKGARCVAGDFLANLKSQEHHGQTFSHSVMNWSRAFYTVLSSIEGRIAGSGFNPKAHRILDFQMTTDEHGREVIRVYPKGRPRDGISFLKEDFEALENALEFFLKIMEIRQERERGMSVKLGVEMIAASDLIVSHITSIFRNIPSTDQILEIAQIISPSMSESVSRFLSSVSTLGVSISPVSGGEMKDVPADGEKAGEKGVRGGRNR